MQVLKRNKPLCFFKNKLLLSELNKLVVLNLETMKLESEISLPFSWFKKILGRNKFIDRAFRLNVISAQIFNDHIYLAFNKRIYQINPDTLAVKEEFILPRGRGPLNFTPIEGLANFEDGLYFGEYFSNSSKDAADIFSRDRTGVFKKVYTFSNGLINHVHNIIPDYLNKCVWVLTGDFNNAAGIWRSEDNFKTLDPLVVGSQKYRACVAFPTEFGLLYATDTQLERNNICLLKKNENVWESETLFETNGSCIYGCQLKDNYVFSTSTEPGISSKKSKILKYLDCKPGPGIIENESQIVLGNLKDGFRVIDKKKKDFLPYRLFQFGTIYFPAGTNPTNKLFSYSIANVGNDMDTEVREIN